MPDDRFPVELVSGVPVVMAPEEVDITNAPELRAALASAAGGGSAIFVADLTRTRFCDSSGVHALVTAHRSAQAEGGQLLLAACAPAVLRVLAVTGVDRVIPSFTSLQDALART